MQPRAPWDAHEKEKVACAREAGRHADRPAFLGLDRRPVEQLLTDPYRDASVGQRLNEIPLNRYPAAEENGPYHP